MATSAIASVLLSLALALVLHFFYRMYKARTRFRGLPQPPHSFLLGHLKVMGEAAATLPPNTHPQAYMTSIAQKYSLEGIFYMDLWPLADPQAILISPELMTQVTTTHNLPKHPIADDFLAPVVGRNNIATANGAVWKKSHSAMAPAFSWSNIRNLTSVVVEEALLFRSALTNFAKTGSPFSMESTSAKLIFDVIARVVFNAPLHAQTKGSADLNDFREMIGLAEAQLSWNPWVKFRAWRRRMVVLKRLDARIVTMIKQRYQVLRTEGVLPDRKNPNSILDLMLREQLKADGGAGNGEIDSEWLNLLLVNVKALLVGGHGTTTDTLCFIYMMLSQSPEAVAKLREEHTRVFDADFDKTVKMLLDSPQQLNDLTYTTGVIQETLRLFPVGFNVRAAVDGSTLTYNDKAYPIENLVVVVNGHYVHYNPKNFPNPSEFQPERWTDPDNAVPRSHFWTFSRGPRACMGLNLAQDELRVILLMTIRDFDFECVGLKPHDKPKTPFTDLDTVFGDMAFQELGLEAKPRHGMMMRVMKRA